MEPAGLALGIIGVAGLFKSCVELYGYISDYQSYSADYENLDIKLNLEKTLLLQWADRLRLLHEDYDQRLDNPTTQLAVFQTLSQIKQLLGKSSTLRLRYGVSVSTKALSPDSRFQLEGLRGSLMDKITNDFSAMEIRKQQRHATTSTASKFKWIITDKSKFDSLIQELFYFRSNLDNLFPQAFAAPDVSLLAAQILREMKLIKNSHGLIEEVTGNRYKESVILQEARHQERALQSIWFRCMEDRKDSVTPAHFKTLAWALKAPENLVIEAEWDDLSEWLRSGTGLYWICGKAGSGKSTLMKFLHGNQDTKALLSTWAGGLPLSVGTFFFWGLGTEEQKSLDGLSRAILYQLLEAQSSIISSVLPRLWKETVTKVDELPKPPSSAELMAAFALIFRILQPQRRFCFLVDGLDEFEGNFHDAIKLIKDLCTNPAIKIIVSSRPIPICCEAFSYAPQLRLEYLTRNDVTEYINDTIGSHSYMKALAASDRQPPSLITEALIVKASGVFLWVVLSCRSILDGFAAHDNVKELCQRVDELPPELEDLFSHMLQKVERRYYEQMAKILKILYTFHASGAATRRQLPLTTIELACFDRSDMDCTSTASLAGFSGDEMRTICTAMVGRLRSRCGGLVQVEPLKYPGRELSTAKDLRELGPPDSGGLKVVCFCSSTGGVRPTNPAYWREFYANGEDAAHQEVTCPVSYGYPAPSDHTHVEFLHRSVVEFLASPSTWELGPLKISDRGFDPASALAGMELQLEYLYCRNGAETMPPLQLLQQLDERPQIALPILPKLADYLCLKTKRRPRQPKNRAVHSPFHDSNYDRLSPQLSLLMAVEADMVNTVQFLHEKEGFFDKQYFPFPILYHAVRVPLLYKASVPSVKITKHLLSQGYSPTEPFDLERGWKTTPWKELILIDHELLLTYKPRRGYNGQYPGKDLNTNLMVAFIEHNNKDLGEIPAQFGSVARYVQSRISWLTEPTSGLKYSLGECPRRSLYEIWIQSPIY